MNLEMRALGRRVADARGRAGLTQQELAAGLGMDRSTLAKIEVGDRKVSALELAGIARAVGERIEWFVAEPPAAIVSHRNMADPGEPSPQIDVALERRARAVEFVLDAHDTFSLADVRMDVELNDAVSAEALATEARQLMSCPTDGPIIGLADQVETLGLLPFVADLGPDAADAASILLPRGGVCLVNGSLRVGRRRLALAHELGHYLVADEYTVDWRVETSSASRSESLFDRFARALLLPGERLQADWHGYLGSGDVREAAVRIASVYRVNMSTLARRLIELDVLGREDAAQVRETRTTRADIVDYDLVVGEELHQDQMPRDYLRAVLDLYRHETISTERALDLLFGMWSVDDLPALPVLPENAIWQFV